MLPTRKNIIADITDEVNDFHPLLNRLFRKLPNIKQVEYRHGNGEMGADFVLSKDHEILRSTEYIGVIVKIGKILQDYSGIKRQIEDCQVERKFNAGKKNIRLTEIWVVVTEHVSRNAQDKIHEDFRGHSIQFIEGAQIADLVDQYLPHYWTEIAPEVSEYLTSLRTRNDEMDKKLSLIQVGNKSLCIDQDLARIERQKYATTKGRPIKRPKVHIKTELQKYDVIWIEGNMGAGKSKLLRKIVDEYTTPESYIETLTIPVPLTFKELMDEYSGDVQKAVDDRISNSIDETEREKSNFLILIDAVDEKDIPLEDQIAALQNIRVAIDSNAKFKGIITSRSLRGIDKSQELFAGMAQYELSPLTVAQIVKFLTALCSELNIKSRFVEDLKKSQLFKELPRSPIGAILLAELINNNSQDLPSNLTELYAKYLELMLGRWDIDKGLQSQKEYEALDSILMRLARYVIENELTELSISEVQEMFTDYLKDRNLNIEAEELYEKMRQRCEIIAINDQDNVLYFKHRTFAEFFYAKSLLRTGDVQVDTRIFQPYWTNTFFFCLGIQKDAPEFLKQIFALSTTAEFERWMKVVNMGNFLLAAYATPYATITEGIEKTMVSTAELYQDIANGDINSPFSYFPRMHLLYLMQRVIRDSYSFDFLKTAMEEAALSIESGDYAEYTKAYSLFLISVACIDMGSQTAFDFLLSEHSKALPEDLARAIYHEGRIIPQRSQLLKKHNRKVERALKNNSNAETTIDALYNRPIKALPRGNSDA